ncbi:hypothetical protein CB1_000639017 [Camelus ferus]|nr:hypothetical protein CB1_000639017 [Camelus ferus]
MNAGSFAAMAFGLLPALDAWITAVWSLISILVVLVAMVLSAVLCSPTGNHPLDLADADCQTSLFSQGMAPLAIVLGNPHHISKSDHWGQNCQWPFNLPTTCAAGICRSRDTGKQLHLYVLWKEDNMQVVPIVKQPISPSLEFQRFLGAVCAPYVLPSRKAAPGLGLTTGAQAAQGRMLPNSQQ